MGPRESREGALRLEAPGLSKGCRDRVVQRCGGPRGSRADALGGSRPGMGRGWRPPQDARGLTLTQTALGGRSGRP